jgi:hypothetical protein
MVSDLHIFQYEIGVQPFPVRFDPPNLHRLTDRLRRRLFNLGLVIAYFWQHCIAQGK